MKNNATVFSVDDAVITAPRFVIVPPPKNKVMANESDNPLSEYVRQVMRDNGLSAEAVAKTAKSRGGEIGRSTVQQIVQGKTPNPGIFTLQDLALGLSVPLEELLTKALGRRVGETQGPAATEFATLADLYRQLPLPEQRAVKRYYLQALEREMRRCLTPRGESG